MIHFNSKFEGFAAAFVVEVLFLRYDFVLYQTKPWRKVTPKHKALSESPARIPCSTCPEVLVLSSSLSHRISRFTASRDAVSEIQVSLESI